MEEKQFKVTGIQIFLFLSIIVTFLPNGLIYRSEQALQITYVIYLLQFLFYTGTILLCAKKGFWLFSTSIICFMVWGVVLLISTYNYSREITKMFRAVIYLMGILAIFWAIKYMFYYQNKKIFSMLFWIFNIFFLLNIGTVFLKPEGIVRTGWQGVTYWFGGKFITFYMFYTWLCLYMIKKRKWRIIAYILPFLVGIYISLRTDCSTGLACVYVTALFLIFRKLVLKIKPYMLIVIVLGITTIMVFSEVLFSNEFFQYFVVNVLHRSTKMTGRVEIYGAFFRIMKSDIWLGAGFENSIVSQNTSLGYLNAQNGILDIITQTGLVGLIPFIFMLYSFWREGCRFLHNIENQIAAVFLMGFVFCSFAEISFNSYFFLLLALFSGDLSKISGWTKENSNKRL